MLSVGTAIGVAAVIAAIAFAAQAAFSLFRALARPSGEVYSGPRAALAPPDPAVPPRGTVVPTELGYFLPRTTLRLVFNYTITERRRVRYGVDTGAAPAPVRVRVRSVEVTPVLVADERNPLRLCDAKGSPARDVSESLVFNEDGTLLALNTTVTDRTAEVFEGLVGAAGRVAVLGVGLGLGGADAAVAAAADAEERRVREAFHDALRGAYLELAARAQEPGATAEALVPVKLRIDTLLAGLREFEAGNGVRESDRDASFERTLDPEALAAPRVIPFTDDGTDAGVAVGVLTVTLQAPEGGPAELRSPQPAALQRGVLYRVPRPLRVTVAFAGPADAAPQPVFDQVIPFAQFGDLGAVPTGAGRLSSVATGVKFSPRSGRLLELSRQVTSTAAAAAARVTATADTLARNVEDARKKSGDVAEIERLQLETRLLVARAKREQARDPTQARSMIM